MVKLLCLIVLFTPLDEILVAALVGLAVRAATKLRRREGTS